jgi:hypothetical protein
MLHAIDSFLRGSRPGEQAALEREAGHDGRGGGEGEGEVRGGPRSVPYYAVSLARAPAACTARERVSMS